MPPPFRDNYMYEDVNFFQKLNVTKQGYKNQGHFLGNATVRTSANARRSYEDVSRSIMIS